MTIEMSSEPQIDPEVAQAGDGGAGGAEAGGAESEHDVRPGDVFTAVVSDGFERWRVVAVLGIRVLAERVGGGERRSFTLRFVRHRLWLRAQAVPDPAPVV